MVHSGTPRGTVGREVTGPGTRVVAHSDTPGGTPPRAPVGHLGGRHQAHVDVGQPELPGLTGA